MCTFEVGDIDFPWFVLTADLSLFVYAATYRSNDVHIWGAHLKRIWEVSNSQYVDQRDNFGFKDIAENKISWDVTPCLWEFSDVSKERGVFVFRVKQS